MIVEVGYLILDNPACRRHARQLPGVERCDTPGSQARYSHLPEGEADAGTITDRVMMPLPRMRIPRASLHACVETSILDETKSFSHGIHASARIVRPLHVIPRHLKVELQHQAHSMGRTWLMCRLYLRRCTRWQAANTPRTARQSLRWRGGREATHGWVG